MKSFALCFAVVAVCLSFSLADETVTKQIVDGKTVVMYTDESRNYTKRVVHDVLAGPTTYATQSVSITTSGAFVGTAQLYAARTDDMVTITFKALTGTVNAQQSLHIAVLGVLNEEFYPRNLGSPEHKSSWPVCVSDGSDQIGKVFWHGYKVWVEPSWNQWAYFRVYSAVSSGNFGTGSGRGYNRDISISFRRY